VFKVKHNIITKEVLQSWYQKFVPNIDYFYFVERPGYVSVMDRASVELSLDIKTSFLPWNVTSNAHYVSVVSNDEFLMWEEEIQKAVLREQIRLNRGYIFELEELLNVLGESISVDEWNLLEAYAIDHEGKKMVTLQGFLWKDLSDHAKTSILLYIAKMFVDMDSISFTTDLDAVKSEYPRIATLLNTFGKMNGPNCLGAVLSALQENEDKLSSVLSKWVLPSEFYEELKKMNYEKVSTTNIQPNDILVWEKDQNTLHSCFMLSRGLVFNKQGQTMFNPYQCIPLENVLSNWNWVESSGGHLHIYRKSQIKS
jgi:hypothetical protein